MLVFEGLMDLESFFFSMVAIGLVGNVYKKSNFT